MNVRPLPTGGALRMTGPADGPVVVCMNGGTAREVPGDWSPSIEWLVDHLAPRFPEVGFAEIRYRTKSWHKLDRLVADARAGVASVRAGGARRVALLGFSAGGAAGLACAAAEGIGEVIALAPWIPEDFDPGALDGARVTVIHGSLDGSRLGLIGVAPDHSRAGVERLRAAGVEATHTVIPGAVHGVAVRPFGRLVALPRARTWLKLTGAEIARWTGRDPA
jgi:acetyl esterase/lipase